ncbi:hypothetical protein E5676_scaffold2047G00140 [Cucumis melo var. makuwa]|uniref:Uncharacterized protein n=1 Tax=Cucumis melo var. makuwa TaxID=1194695 RepID=A0A5A7T6I0_CUCMM|nr:hypothetical protein E6C27_scaffold84G001930 [Cucumis melo var. makuwa]TYK14883.1 hypothetical protein E5676_scaffold2047G00140 [Cucumis melo var. makuwa]
MIMSDSMGHSQPDCLSVSFGYTTDQLIPGVPLGHRRLDMFLRDHRLHVFGNVPVQGGRGKRKGKLATDKK